MVEAAAPPFTHFLGADEATNGLISAYFGLQNNQGYKLDFATTIIPSMLVVLTARMKAAERPDIRNDEFFASGFFPKRMRLAVSTTGPAIVYELGDGITVAMHIPKELLADMFDQIGRYLQAS